MARQSKIINMSLPLEVYKGVEELARRKRVSRSEILREALKQYVAAEKLWQQIYLWGKESAKKLRIKKEGDGERLIHEFRKEQAQR